MRAVVQRVREASVRVDGEVVGTIGLGLLVYIGVGKNDDDRDVSYMVRKISGLRIFEDEGGLMNRSIVDVKGSVLLVSQFTLYGDCRKGLRPSFNDAMAPEEAKMAIDSLRRGLKGLGVRTAQGRFGAMMEVESRNWGPVTILIDSEKVF